MKLKEERQRAKFTQIKLANIACIDLSTLQKYERGARSIDGASLKTLLRLAIALNCRLEDIIEDEETVEMLRRVRVF